MKKIIYAAGKRGGKSNWLIENMEKEYAAGRECFYMGGRKTYEDTLAKLTANNSLVELTLVDKEHPPLANSAVFTDDLLWETSSIFPFTVRNMRNIDCVWYVTLNTEGAVNLKKEPTTEN